MGGGGKMDYLELVEDLNLRSPGYKPGELNAIPTGFTRPLISK